MGATIVKVDSRDLHPSKKQLELQKKLLAGPTMTEEEYKEFKKNNKWMRKWKI